MRDVWCDAQNVLSELRCIKGVAQILSHQVCMAVQEPRAGSRRQACALSIRVAHRRPRPPSHRSLFSQTEEGASARGHHHHFLGGAPPETNNARRGEFIAPETGAALHLRPLMSSPRLPPLAHRSVGARAGRRRHGTSAEAGLVSWLRELAGCTAATAKPAPLADTAKKHLGTPSRRSAGAACRGPRACPTTALVLWPCRPMDGLRGSCRPPLPLDYASLNSRKYATKHKGERNPVDDDACVRNNRGRYSISPKQTMTRGGTKTILCTVAVTK